jgi:hypothetical protein
MNKDHANPPTTPPNGIYGVLADFGVAEGLPLPKRLVVRQHGLACWWALRAPRPDGNGSVAATLTPADGAFSKHSLVHSMASPLPVYAKHTEHSKIADEA